MKKKSIISLLICSMTLGVTTTSCQDMLTPDSERHAYTVAQDTLYSYWGVLKSLQNVAERYVILNECRGDLVDGSSYVSDTIAAIINFGKNGYEDKWKDGACAYLKVSDFYHVINSCNAYIAMCDTTRKISTGQQKSYMLREYAQVQAIRAWVYMQLIYAYGKVPFYMKPMLTTDEINNFISDPSHPTADAKTLASLLGPELEKVYSQLDPEDMYPQYNNYQSVCHSMRVMFPVDVVLGDLYLMQGDETACQKAAQYYYKFINSKFCGPLECDRYLAAGDVIEGEDDPQYSYYGYNGLTPFEETSHTLSGGRYRQEAITCIPCNYGKLDGKVFTDIDRLFGFEATLASGNVIIKNEEDNSEDVATYSSVTLNYMSNGYRRELLPSRGYEALCDSQQYECYIGDATEPYQELVTLPTVGDARRAWIYDCSGTRFSPRSRQYRLPVGDDTQYGKLVSKQCPDGFFTNTYPLVYRKATVWLHFAEAINRAGFPSLAFAILKNGLVSNHNQWFPAVNEEGNESWAYGTSGSDYGVKDSLYYYIEKPDADDKSTWKYWGSNYEEGVEIGKLADLQAYVEAKYQAEADATNAGLGEGETPVAPKAFDTKNVYFYAKSFNNYPADDCLKTLWYVDRREMSKLASYPWMNFNNQRYLQGYQTYIEPRYKRDIYNRNSFFTPNIVYRVSGASETSDYVTIGVHQRGCGILKTDDPERWSSYNYVDMVTKKIKEEHGITVTKDQIYGEDYKDWVKEAVEDLIIDEDALELAFEGCRFSDLARVAIRRGDNRFLASRVAKRSGSMDMKLYNVLLDDANWYLPFPTE